MLHRRACPTTLNLPAILQDGSKCLDKVQHLSPLQHPAHPLDFDLAQASIPDISMITYPRQPRILMVTAMTAGTATASLTIPPALSPPPTVSTSTTPTAAAAATTIADAAHASNSYSICPSTPTGSTGSCLTSLHPHHTRRASE